MGMIIGLFGMLGFIVTLVVLIIRAIKKKSKKVAAILLPCFFVCFIIGVVITPTTPTTPNADTNTAPDTTSTPVIEGNTSVPSAGNETTMPQGDVNDENFYSGNTIAEPIADIRSDGIAEKLISFGFTSDEAQEIRKIFMALRYFKWVNPCRFMPRKSLDMSAAHVRLCCQGNQSRVATRFAGVDLKTCAARGSCQENRGINRRTSFTHSIQRRAIFIMCGVSSLEGCEPTDPSATIDGLVSFRAVWDKDRTFWFTVDKREVFYIALNGVDVYDTDKGAS